MSLFRQLWLAIISLTIFIFIGSFLVSVLSARSYLEQQLTLKNIDNAESLALAISQQPNRDPVAVALVIAAQFDTGHYQLIRLIDPERRVVVEKQYKGTGGEAPAWFERLFPLRATQGVAQVQDGWRQLGTLTVISHNRFAYRELWHGALKLLAWFLAAGLIAGGVGSLVMRAIARPLNQVVGQAHAITERRFITLAEPRTPELQSVVRAMNTMVSRLKQMFTEEADRLDHLRREVSHDAVTGLANREAFMIHLQENLSREDAAPLGILLLVRLSDLGEINRQRGYGEADALLKLVASTLTAKCAEQSECFAARLNGADFALIFPNATHSTELAKEITEALNRRLASSPVHSDSFHVGAIAYHRGAHPGKLMAAADQALANAESKGPNTWHVLIEQADQVTRSAEAWRGLLTNALSNKRLKLALFPVKTLQGKILHAESAVRLQAEKDGPWLVAGDFIPMAARLKLSAALDQEVVQQALSSLQTAPGGIAVNLSAETIADWGFRNRLSGVLAQQPELCAKLWFEVSEYGALRQLEAFRDLVRGLKAKGCRIGIEHAGHRLSELAQLADVGLDYIKVDSSFIRNIDQNPGNQEFLKGLCKMAQALGMQVIAEGVQTDAELSELYKLGFDGATGPLIT